MFFLGGPVSLHFFKKWAPCKLVQKKCSLFLTKKTHESSHHPTIWSLNMWLRGGQVFGEINPRNLNIIIFGLADAILFIKGRCSPYESIRYLFWKAKNERASLSSHPTQERFTQLAWVDVPLGSNVCDPVTVIYVWRLMVWNQMSPVKVNKTTKKNHVIMLHAAT